MQIIAGKYKKRLLKSLPGLNTRPTTQRIKEDMFNMLNNYFIFEGKTSLDLFAGSGALSLEGLSRGIKFAYVNDVSQEALEVVRENFHGISPKDYVIENEDYLVSLSSLSRNNQKVDLIYLDPPFPHIEYYYNFFEEIQKAKILNNWGVILVESPEALDLSKINQLALLKDKHVRSKVDKYIYIFRLEDKSKDE